MNVQHINGSVGPLHWEQNREEDAARIMAQIYRHTGNPTETSRQTTNSPTRWQQNKAHNVVA